MKVLILFLTLLFTTACPAHAYTVAREVIKEVRTTITFDFSNEREALKARETDLDLMEKNQKICDQKATAIRDAILRQQGLKLSEITFNSPCAWSLEVDEGDLREKWAVGRTGVIRHIEKLP